MRIGDNLTMHFSMMGLVSHEELEIMEINEDTIELERGDCETWIFNKRTGKCLNDNTFMGARRYIDPIE